MNDPLQPTRCASLLAALADPTRLQIVRYLTAGPHTVTEVAAMLEAPVVNTSHHLAVLKRAGLLQSERHGRFISYSLTPNIFQPGDTDAVPPALDLGCCRLEWPQDDS